MAKKKDSGSDFVEKAKFWNDMREETVQTILAIFAFLLTVLSLLAAFGKAGIVGDYAYIFFTLHPIRYFFGDLHPHLVGAVFYCFSISEPRKSLSLYRPLE